MEQYKSLEVNKEEKEAVSAMVGERYRNINGLLRDNIELDAKYFDDNSVYINYDTQTIENNMQIILNVYSTAYKSILTGKNTGQKYFRKTSKSEYMVMKKEGAWGSFIHSSYGKDYNYGEGVYNPTNIFYAKNDTKVKLNLTVEKDVPKIIIKDVLGDELLNDENECLIAPFSEIKLENGSTSWNGVDQHNIKIQKGKLKEKR